MQTDDFELGSIVAAQDVLDDYTEAEGVESMQSAVVSLGGGLQFDFDVLAEAVHAELHQSAIHDALECFTGAAVISAIVFAHQLNI